MSPGAEATLALATRLLDAAEAGAAVPGPLAVPPAETLALAWAFKDLCYSAWSGTPARAALAAGLLAALSAQGLQEPERLQVHALADWTAGIAHLTRGQMADAVQAFDRAAGGLRQAGLPDPAAQTQVPKIMALSMLGRHDEATACAQATQRTLLALGNVRAAARVSQNLGGALLLHDAYVDAAVHFREAAVLFARLGDHGHSVLADLGLADALAAQGDFDEALRIYARARMRATNQGLERQLALADESQALLDLVRGRYRQALVGMEAARRRFQALEMPQYQATAERQLADAYLELHLLPEALALLEAAVAQFSALQLPVEQAWALAQCGRAQAMLGLRREADQSFSAAAELFAAQGGAVGGAAVAQARGELALESGDASDALRWATQACDAFAAAGQADGSARAQVLRARALLALGQVDAARASFDATLAQARALQQVQMQVRCLTGQGLCLLAGSTDPANAAQARQAFEAAIELFEDQRRALPGDDIRSAFLHDHLRPYQECLRMAVAAGDGAQVLWQLDRFRARALDERLAERTREGAPPDAAQAELQPLRERVNWLVRRVQRLQDEGESSAAFDAELQRTERDLLERARRLRLAAPLQADLGGGQAFDVAALQAALGPADALVEYGVLDDELFACVATAAGVVLVRHMASWRAVLQAWQAARFQIDALRQGTAAVARHLDVLTTRAASRLQQLHALVWAPLEPALQGCRRVLVVPHAQLGSVPFAALGNGQSTLAQRHQLAVAASARAVLRGLQRPVGAVQRAVAIGASAQLPHAAAEARFVASLFAEGLAFTGDEATLQRLQAHAHHADVLHLACHAQFRSDSPRFSALHLHDAPLTVEDAEALALPHGIVVLSACETGLADVATGDEMVGLVRAFTVAGARRVLASLWPVDDAVTRAFMAAFYGGLVRGLQPAAALQAAQLQTQATQAHAYFWAPFTLYGGW